ncbi:MAG: thioesterase family protein [Alphaproteobacteria bacterium]|nr:thioesterase family protein [Alphaproteobacteria bacterium]MBL6937225.1 thioesterase family protein [Alphaproteobacteria bacterium]MBL7096213.1 thioesterase family protein [Alphaproteobacteria bacterium]
MTAFTDLFASIAAESGTYRATMTDDWLQGRTAYGGLSSSLCLEAARRAVPDLPPLRSAQFTLIGPASGPLSMTPTVLRRGKSAVFVNVDLVGEAGLAVRAVLSFGVARASQIGYSALPMPAVTPIADSPPFFPGDRSPIGFQQHFESRLAGGTRPVTPGAKPEYLIWYRHKDERARQGIVPLIALADGPPPAVMAMFPQFAPISTMTWSVDVLTDEPQTADGWWLIRSLATTAHQGYSTQSMIVWNASGEPVLAHAQNVAIFL